jgi:hypothetical protein
MKISPSIPDSLVKKTDHSARRNRRSRHDFFRAAVAEYVSRHAPADVTNAMDRVCREAPGESDGFVAAVGQHVLMRLNGEP